jgi:uncharacterized protein YbjQ (UPF0145 family)
MKRAIIAGALVLLAAAPQAYAADRRVEFPLSELLNSPEAKEAGIDGSVRFFLAGQPTPGVGQRLGEDISNKKSNAFAKSDQTACYRAMLSALKAFQESAKRKNANAVIDMVSFYKRNEERSSTNFVCYAGGIMAAVTMKGTYAKIR